MQPCFCIERHELASFHWHKLLNFQTVLIGKQTIQLGLYTRSSVTSLFGIGIWWHSCDLWCLCSCNFWKLISHYFGSFDLWMNWLISYGFLKASNISLSQLFLPNLNCRSCQCPMFLHQPNSTLKLSGFCNHFFCIGFSYRNCWIFWFLLWAFHRGCCRGIWKGSFCVYLFQ